MYFLTSIIKMSSVLYAIYLYKLIYQVKLSVLLSELQNVLVILFLTVIVKKTNYVYKYIDRCSKSLMIVQVILTVFCSQSLYCPFCPSYVRILHQQQYNLSISIPFITCLNINNNNNFQIDTLKFMWSIEGVQ